MLFLENRWKIDGKALTKHQKWCPKGMQNINACALMFLSVFECDKNIILKSISHHFKIMFVSFFGYLENVISATPIKEIIDFRFWNVVRKVAKMSPIPCLKTPSEKTQK